jgi:hypothetical protein
VAGGGCGGRWGVAGGVAGGVGVGVGVRHGAGAYLAQGWRRHRRAQAAAAARRRPPDRAPPLGPALPGQASDRGCGLQAEALVGLIFGHLLPGLDVSGLVDLLDFMQNT